MSDPATYYSFLTQSVKPRCHSWVSTAGSLRLDLSAPRKWRGGDGLLDQMPDPEPVDGGPTRAAVDWHELVKHAPDVVDDERSMPALADRRSCAVAAA